MGGVGDLTRTVADGIGGLVVGAVAALVDGFNTIVTQLQAWLPGPLFPIVVVSALVVLVWLSVKK